MYERILPDSGREPTEEEVLNADANMTDAQVEGDKLRQEAIKQVYEAGQECGLSDEEIKEALSTLTYNPDKNQTYSGPFIVVIKGISVRYNHGYDSPIIKSLEGVYIEEDSIKKQLNSKYGNFIKKLDDFWQMQQQVQSNVNQERGNYYWSDLNKENRNKKQKAIENEKQEKHEALILAHKLKREQEEERVAKAVQKLLD